MIRVQDLILILLVLCLGVTLAEWERWRTRRPWARGVYHFLAGLFASAILVWLLAAGLAQLVQATTVGVWSTVGCQRLKAIGNSRLYHKRQTTKGGADVGREDFRCASHVLPASVTGAVLF